MVWLGLVSYLQIAKSFYLVASLVLNLVAEVSLCANPKFKLHTLLELCAENFINF